MPCVACRGRLGDYERERQRHESLRDQLNLVAGSEPERVSPGRPNFALLIVLGLVGVALIAAGILVGGAALPLGITGGLALLATAAALLLLGKTPPSAGPSPMAAPLGQQTAQAEAAANAARQLLLESAAALELTEQPNAADLDTVEAHLASARQTLDAWIAAFARVEETFRREKLQQERVEAAAVEHAAAEAAELESLQEWRDWLRVRGLNETLTADTMTTFLTRVELTRSSLAEAQRMADRVAAIEHDIEEFRERVQPLAVRHGIKLDPADQRQMAAAADELIRRLDETRTSVSNRERAKDQEKESRQRLERQEERLKQVASDIDALLTAGGAADAEDFRRRVRMHEDRQGLERQRDEHLRSLERISGPGDKFDAFRESLANSDPAQLAEESDRLSDRRTEVGRPMQRAARRAGRHRQRVGPTDRRGGIIVSTHPPQHPAGATAGAGPRVVAANNRRVAAGENAAQIRAGTPAQRDPTRAGILFHGHRPEVHRAVRAPWGADNIGDRRHRRQSAALGTEPGHPGAALPGAAIRADPGVRRARRATAGRCGRGSGQLRPGAGPPGRGVLRRSLRNQPGFGFYLPPSHRRNLRQIRRSAGGGH